MSRELRSEKPREVEERHNLGAFPRCSPRASPGTAAARRTRVPSLSGETMDRVHEINVRRYTEARNALARAVFFNRLGELRDRSYEDQHGRASAV